MRRSFRYMGLILCVLFSMQLIACSIIPGSSETTDTTKATNVFEATNASDTGTTSGIETYASVSVSSVSDETVAPTAESTSATSSAPTETASTAETTRLTEPSSTSAKETEITGSSTSGETSETTLPKDCLAIYEKDPQDEKNYILFNDASGFAITSSAADGGLKGVSIPSTGNCLTGNLPEGALFFTLFFDERKNFTLRDQNGNFLVLTPEGELALTNKPVEDRYNFWKLEKANNGWTIINAGDPSGRAIQYNAGTFTFTANRPLKTNEFVFNFYEVG